MLCRLRRIQHIDTVPATGNAAHSDVTSEALGVRLLIMSSRIFAWHLIIYLDRVEHLVDLRFKSTKPFYWALPDRNVPTIVISDCLACASKWHAEWACFVTTTKAYRCAHRYKSTDLFTTLPRRCRRPRENLQVKKIVWTGESLTRRLSK